LATIELATFPVFLIPRNMDDGDGGNPGAADHKDGAEVADAPDFV